MELIAKHQFQPNAIARSLFKKETGMIGVILPDITNPFFQRFCQAWIKKRAAKATLFSMRYGINERRFSRAICAGVAIFEYSDGEASRRHCDDRRSN